LLHKQLYFFSKYNGAEDQFLHYSMEHTASFENVNIEIYDSKDRTDSFKKGLLNNKLVRKNFAIIIFLWMTCSLTYYIFTNLILN
jgi:hypothetical protein